MDTPPIDETFGMRVKRLREAKLVKWNGEEKPMTQEQLAERCNCCKETISRIERDEQIPMFPLGLAIAKALGVSPYVLAGIAEP
jgi:transcriptional regulator with XRE-family HTH domain